jgi:thiol:disulfide interchange protein DsbD
MYCFSALVGGDALAQPLPVGKAFELTGFVTQDKQLVLQWNIAPGYYLYREEFNFSPSTTSKVMLGPIQLPTGQTRKDAFHGVFQSYSGLLAVTIPLVGNTRQPLDLTIAYQGCSEAGFCYPPVKAVLKINLAKIVGPTDVTAEIVAAGPVSRGDHVTAEDLFNERHLVLVLLGFLGLGILLGFTPCVLPMVPILSSIIVGVGNNIGTRKAFLLSLMYVLGMALSYANAGMIVALAGSNVQAMLQNPWVIGLFSALFVLLAVLLFSSYNLQLPGRLHQRVMGWCQRHQGGTYVSVFFMGGFSTLVVSPCVSAPLVGVLAYIGNSGDVLLGGAALLALGIGMGVPLLVIGTAAGKWLPKSGAWMNQIKHLFGFFMLGLAITMVARVLPERVTLYLWAGLLMLIALYVWRLQQSHQLWRQVHRLVGVALLSYGVILLCSAVLGYSNPLNLFGQFTPVGSAPFTVVKNMAEFDQRLAAARQDGKRVLLDFYASWCASCVVMDHHVFNQSQIRDSLQDYVLLRADVTQNNDFDRALLKRYHVVAPPTLVFFDRNGSPLPQDQIVGEISANELLADVSRVNDHKPTRYCQATPKNC